MATFCNRLKEVRKKAKLSQEEAAKQLDIAYSTYRRYEQGGTEPSFPTAIRIANYFNVSLDYLAGRTDDPGILPDKQEE